MPGRASHSSTLSRLRLPHRTSISMPPENASREEAPSLVRDLYRKTGPQARSLASEMPKPAAPSRLEPKPHNSAASSLQGDDRCKRTGHALRPCEKLPNCLILTQLHAQTHQIAARNKPNYSCPPNYETQCQAETPSAHARSSTAVPTHASNGKDNIIAERAVRSGRPPPVLSPAKPSLA